LSTPRIMLAPTHRSTLPSVVAAAAAEIVGRQRRQVRYHHVGVSSPALAWDRWEGSSFLDPCLYGFGTMRSLYERATRGADLSLLSADRGLFDTDPAAGRSPDGEWTPADVARRLDCPVVLLIDSGGWGEGIAALANAFNERARDWNLAGLLLCGVENRDSLERLRGLLARTGVPVVGAIYADGRLDWEMPAAGPAGLPLSEEALEAVFSQIDITGLEDLAGQRGFLPRTAQPTRAPVKGPVVLVAGGRGFTPWSRDSIELLEEAGAEVRRLDLLEDDRLPEEAAGLVLAGHLWPEALPELSQNFSLMRDIRLRINEGLPTLALGGGMLYLLRRLQTPSGRTFALAGVLPSEGELLGELRPPEYMSLEARRGNLLFEEGERLVGWVTADAEIAESPVARNFAFSVGEGGRSQLEGAVAARLVCARVLVHLASVEGTAERFVETCRSARTGVG